MVLTLPALPKEALAPISLGQVAPSWRSATITLEGTGDPAPALLPSAAHRLRGALGMALKDGASAAAISDSGCDFEPPSASWIFHGTHSRREQPLPKPYVLDVAANGDGIEVECRLAGCATGWGMVFAEALTRAMAAIGLHISGNRTVQYRVHRRTVVEDTFPVLDPHAPTLLSLASPLALYSGKEVFFDRDALARSLANRARGLMAWHGMDLEIADAELARACDALQGAIIDDIRWAEPWTVGRSKGTGAKRTGLLGTMIIPEPGPELSTLLSIATLMHAGAKATEGLGRIELQQATSA